jgi:hypothetical protein
MQLMSRYKLQRIRDCLIDASLVECTSVLVTPTFVDPMSCVGWYGASEGMGTINASAIYFNVISAFVDPAELVPVS